MIAKISKARMKEFQGRSEFTVWEAACLFEEIDPENPDAKDDPLVQDRFDWLSQTLSYMGPEKTRMQ